MATPRSRLMLSSLALAVAAAFAVGTASAHDPNEKKDHAAMEHGKMDNMHMMPATVDAVDAKTGMVEVTSDGMKLKLHFPPASLANVKVGDKITVHLGFTKG